MSILSILYSHSLTLLQSRFFLHLTSLMFRTELRNRLEGLRRAADVVSVSLRALGWSERALGERPRARVADTLKDVGVKADRVFATTRAVYNEAADLRRIVRYNLMREIFVQQYGGPQLGEAQELGEC